jgi:hypothetical protein
MLDNRTLNASFGVAELTEEDDATSLFVRADQALLRAKETGRNRTIRASSLKSKSNPTNERKATDSVCPDEWRKLSYNPLLVSEFCSGDILQMFIKKVQTMAEELSGQITNVTENSLTISLSAVSETKPHQKAQLIVDIDVVSPEKSPFIHSFPPHTKLLVRVAMIAKKGLFQPRDATPVAKTLMKQIRAALSFGHDSELFVSKLKEADKERYG